MRSPTSRAPARTYHQPITRGALLSGIPLAMLSTMRLTLSTTAHQPCLGDARGAGRASSLSLRKGRNEGCLVVHTFVGEAAPLDRTDTVTEDLLDVPSGLLCLGGAGEAEPATAWRIPPGAYRITYAPPSAEYIERLTILALEAKARQAMVAMNIFILVTFLTFILMAVACLKTGLSYGWGYAVPCLVGLAMLARAHHEHRAGARRYDSTVKAFPSLVALLEPVATKPG